jgi:hypothetical protein
MIVCLLLGPLLGCLSSFVRLLRGSSRHLFAMLTLAFADRLVGRVPVVIVTGSDAGLGVWPEMGGGAWSFYWLSIATAAVAVPASSCSRRSVALRRRATLLRSGYRHRP